MSSAVLTAARPVRIAPRFSNRPDAPFALAVHTLGSFAVARDGATLSISDWQARKVRDLFKLLVTRRGRALTRDAAIDVLWPGATGREADLVRSRLSVTLSTLRKVLDPGKRLATDHFVAADRRSLCLRTEHVEVDVVAFLDAVELAEASADRDDWSTAELLLARARAAYTGDFLEEDLYEDWAVDCREHARSAAVRAARMRVDAARRRDDHAAVVRRLEWLLELDPFDEPAWLTLLDELRLLRRHGDGRRQHARYARRMREIGVAPRGL